VLVAELAAGRRGVWPEALELLARIPDLDLAPVLELAADPRAAVRRRAARLLAVRPEAEARERLAELAEGDPDPRVRRSARRRPDPS
jgi:hypothetical protein